MAYVSLRGDPTVYLSFDEMADSDFSVIGGGKSEPPAGYKYFEYRSYQVLHFVESGEGEVMGQPVKAPAFFWLEGGTMRGYTVSSDPDAKPWRQYWLILDGKGAVGFLESLGFCAGEYVKNCYDKECVVSSFASLFSRDAEHINAFTPLSVLYTCADSITAGTIGGSRKPKSDYADVAKAYIDRFYSEKITMQSVADYLNISSKHLYRVFKTRYGISANEYLNDVRMKHAKELLENTDMSVFEVSEAVGFYDRNYFSQVFKKFFGTAPLKWRKKES